MKKILVLFIILIFVLISFSSCYIKDKKPENSSSCISQELPSFMDNIGKTFNEIKELYPSYEYIQGDYGTAIYCFGNPNKNFSYYFITNQQGITLEEMITLFGDKLKCAGIYSRVGDFFSMDSDSITINDFFSSIGVIDYNVGEENWILFKYINYSAVLDAFDMNKEGNPIKINEIKKERMLLIKDDEIEAYNNKLINDF